MSWIVKQVKHTIIICDYNTQIRQINYIQKNVISSEYTINTTMDDLSYILPYEMSAFLRDGSVDRLILLCTCSHINHKHSLLVQLVVFTGNALCRALAIAPL
jgi:hypothetical protein